MQITTIMPPTARQALADLQDEFGDNPAMSQVRKIEDLGVSVRDVMDVATHRDTIREGLSDLRGQLEERRRPDSRRLKSVIRRLDVDLEVRERLLTIAGAEKPDPREVTNLLRVLVHHGRPEDVASLEAVRPLVDVDDPSARSLFKAAETTVQNRIRAELSKLRAKKRGLLVRYHELVDLIANGEATDGDRKELARINADLDVLEDNEHQLRGEKRRDRWQDLCDQLDAMLESMTETIRGRTTR